MEVRGSKSPTVSIPSLFQSPAMGSHPYAGMPYPKATSAYPDVFELRRKKTDVAGSYSPMVSTPSPFQSPAMGSHPAPGDPYPNMMSEYPDVFELRR